MNNKEKLEKIKKHHTEGIEPFNYCPDEYIGKELCLTLVEYKSGALGYPWGGEDSLNPEYAFIYNADDTHVWGKPVPIDSEISKEVYENRTYEVVSRTIGK